MKKKSFFLLFTFVSVIGYSQQLSINWVNQFGNIGWDNVTCLKQTNEGDLIAGGSFRGSLVNDTTYSYLENNNNAWLIICDSLGNLKKQLVFGGKLFDNISTIEIMSQKDILIGGIFQDSLIFDSLIIETKSYTGAYLALINDFGRPKWLKKIGNGQTVFKNMRSAKSPDGKIFYATSFCGKLNVNDLSLVQENLCGIYFSGIDTNGIETNPIAFTSGGDCNLGGFVYTDSLIYISGSFSDSLFIGDTSFVSHGMHDIFIALFNLEGNLISIKTAGNSLDEQVNDMIVTQDGGIILTGWFESIFQYNMFPVISNGGRDLFLLSLEADFKLRWMKNIGGTGNDYGYSIQSTNQNEVLLSGNFVSDLEVADQTGQLVEFNATSAYGNAFISKFDNHGELKAIYNLPATSEDYCIGMIADSSGTIYAAGNYFGSLMFHNQDSSSQDISSFGDRDIFLVSFRDICDDFSIYAGADTLICHGQSMALYNSIPCDFYQWSPGGSPNSPLMIDTAGIYSIFVVSKDGCVAYDSIFVNEKQLPKVFSGNDTLINAGDVVNLQNTSVQFSSNFEWSTSGTGNFSQYYAVNTTYYPSNEDISNQEMIVSLSAFNDCGLSVDSTTISFIQEDDGISVFPNPTADIVTFVCVEGKTITSATVTTQSNDIVAYNVAVNSPVMQFNLLPYTTGTYVFHLLTSTGVVVKEIYKL